MDIDRKRIAAVRALEAFAYTYRDGEWLAPAGAATASRPLTAEADAMHVALMRPMHSPAAGRVRRKRSN